MVKVLAPPLPEVMLTPATGPELRSTACPPTARVHPILVTEPEGFAVKLTCSPAQADTNPKGAKIGGSWTVTLKWQLALLPQSSFAEQLTVVEPFWNVLPEGGTQVTVRLAPQKSVAVGANVTTGGHCDKTPGQVNVGLFPFIFTVTGLLAGLPHASVELTVNLTW